jgi:hypothetical protein
VYSSDVSECMEGSVVRRPRFLPPTRTVLVVVQVRTCNLFEETSSSVVGRIGWGRADVEGNGGYIWRGSPFFRYMDVSCERVVLANTSSLFTINEL